LFSPVSARDVRAGVNALEAVARKCCFVSGTLVSTKDGLRPIEEVEVGDLVLSRNEATGETGYKPVTELVRRHNREIWTLVMSAPASDGKAALSTFETTDDHPWRTAAGAWVQTMDLKPGMRVLRARGPPVTVVSVERTGVVEATFNLEVADWHTYFVGDAGVWVHNAFCGVRPGTRGHPDHQADVRGPGRAQAEAQARPGERVETESPVVGHPGVRRNADNQIIGVDGRTRLVVESERRPNGSYHKARVRELEACGIECQTRSLPQRQK
jgi:hypothetical protein